MKNNLKSHLPTEETGPAQIGLSRPCGTLAFPPIPGPHERIINPKRTWTAVANTARHRLLLKSRLSDHPLPPPALVLSHQTKKHPKMPIFQVEPTGTKRTFFRHLSIQPSFPQTQPIGAGDRSRSPADHQTTNHQKMPIIKLDQSVSERSKKRRWSLPGIAKTRKNRPKPSCSFYEILRKTPPATQRPRIAPPLPFRHNMGT